MRFDYAFSAPVESDIFRQREQTPNMINLRRATDCTPRRLQQLSASAFNKARASTSFVFA
jgi:hypothetical protein